jgi:hypothetical protein
MSFLYIQIILSVISRSFFELPREGSNRLCETGSDIYQETRRLLPKGLNLHQDHKPRNFTYSCPSICGFYVSCLYWWFRSAFCGSQGIRGYISVVDTLKLNYSLIRGIRFFLNNGGASLIGDVFVS